jgi:hypothetical protein
MYPTALAEALRAAGIDARSASEAGLVGRPDADIFAAAVAEGLTLLTENVSDFARIAADHVNAGGHHHGLLVALSRRSSRRPAGRAPLDGAIREIAPRDVADQVVYLRRPGTG